MSETTTKPCGCCGDENAQLVRSEILEMDACADCLGLFAACNRCGGSSLDLDVQRCECLEDSPLFCAECREEKSMEVFGSRDGWLCLDWKYHENDECGDDGR